MDRLIVAPMAVRATAMLIGLLDAFTDNWLSSLLMTPPGRLGYHSGADSERSSNRQTLSVSATPQACATHPFGK